MKAIITSVLIFIGFQTLFAQNGQFLETNGVKIYYEIHGNGEPLLLIHGGTVSGKFWEPWIDDLSQDHMLIVPDVRGHGNSTNPTQIWTMREVAKDMYSLMDHLGIHNFNAMGQSGGAMTLLHMATSDTTRISNMIIVAGASYFPEESREIQRNVSYETINAEWMDTMVELHPGGEQQIRSLLSQFSAMGDNYDDMNFTPPYLSTISCPTLIIHGDRDPYFPVHIAVEMYEAIPNSFLWIVPNDGHHPADFYGRSDSVFSNALYKTVDNFFAGKWSKN